MNYNREPYLKAVRSQLESNIFNHSLALEACMAGVYDYLQSQGQLGTGEPSKDEWTLAGLIHDVDYGGKFKSEHPRKTKEVLNKYNLAISDAVERIVKSHAPDHTGVKPASKAEWAIFCADSLTGLITAVAYVYPSKKLADVKLSSVVKRFLKEPKFAAGTRRQEVAMCANPDGLSIPVEKFIEVCLGAMQRVAREIGL